MMKKIILFIIFSALLLIPNLQVQADSPYTTWAMGPGHQAFMTQDAYSPYDEISLPINSAEDMFVTPDGLIYIADTGDGQILKLKDFQVVATYGQGVIEQPTGLFVDDQGIIYVTDSKTNSIFILDQNGNVLKQFGRPTGVYQAVSHPLADTYIETELARSLAYWAAWCVAEGDDQTPIAVAAAKSYCSETAVAACETSIQVHGGIGFTWEHDLHLYYKRALWIQAYGGYPRVQRAQVAAWLLDE
jgi:streptogramin lyase